jgi:hypothetical protein
MYTTITTQDTLKVLAIAYVGREDEVHRYQINIDNYNIMVQSLPTDAVPEKLAPYLASDIKDLPVEFTDADVQLLEDYKFRNDLVSRIRSEKAEQSKAKRVLDAIKSQIPVDQFDALIAQAVQSL